mgnify:CR=1 FL=1
MFEGLETIDKEAVLMFDNTDAGLCEFRLFVKVYTYLAIMW